LSDGLYAIIGGHTKTKPPAFDLATAQTVVEQQNGELSLPQRLRCRIRYFTDDDYSPFRASSGCECEAM
jgi:hypothetical protein